VLEEDFQEQVRKIAEESAARTRTEGEKTVMEAAQVQHHLLRHGGDQLRQDQLAMRLSQRGGPLSLDPSAGHGWRIRVGQVASDLWRSEYQEQGFAPSWSIDEVTRRAEQLAKEQEDYDSKAQAAQAEKEADRRNLALANDQRWQAVARGLGCPTADVARAIFKRNIQVAESQLQERELSLERERKRRGLYVGRIVATFAAGGGAGYGAGKAFGKDGSFSFPAFVVLGSLVGLVAWVVSPVLLDHAPAVRDGVQVGRTMTRW